MRKVKCQFCGRKYTPTNERDCCPACGAFNEFVEQPVKQTHTINIHFPKFSKEKFKLPKFISIPLKLVVGFMIFFFGLGFLAFLIEMGESSNRQTISLNYSDDLLTDTSIYMNVDVGGAYYTDWDKEYIITGKYSDIIKCIDYLSEDQISYIKTNVRVEDGKVTALDNTIYIDKIELSWYGYNSATLYLEVESKGESKTEPSSVELYLISEENKVRLKEDSYGITYEDGIDTLKDLFTNYYSGRISLNASILTLEEFDKLQVVVDEEIFEFDLKFNDTKTTITYHGLED